MWYRRASRYRAERNFWLSLFTLVLWLLVYKIYSLKETIVKLKAEVSTKSNEREQKKSDQEKKSD
jgi:predicted Holliday junction resolvase-like endonuclease